MKYRALAYRCQLIQNKQIQDNHKNKRIYLFKITNNVIMCYMIDKSLFKQYHFSHIPRSFNIVT